MKMLRNDYVFMSNEPGAPGGGSGVGAPSPPPTPSPAPTPTPSVLEGAANNNGAQPNLQPHERFSEKHRVFKADNSFDLEATAFKTAEAYTNLEKRFGERAPETVDGYKFESFGEGIDVAQVMTDPIAKSFVEKMHAKGATNAQVQEAISFALNEWLPAALDSNEVLSADQCTTKLREMWKSDDEYKANTSASVRALKAFSDEGDGVGSFNAMFNKYGNDPDFIAFAARIGKELGEDSSPNLDAVMQGQTIEQLESHPAYFDTKHPEHARVNKAVQTYYEAKHGKQPVM